MNNKITNNKLSNKNLDIISHERFKGYERRIIQKNGSCSILDFYAYYNWNTALSESFYTSLQTLEVALRNSIHNHASSHFDSDQWFDVPGVLLPDQIKNIKVAKKKLEKNCKNLNAGRVLAELSFGFWTSLFNKRYDQILWHPLIKKVFPCMSNKMRTRAKLSKRLNNIRHLRNRIFHYEPIWYYNDLKKQHDDIIQTIGWIEPEMKALVAVIDQFLVCYDSKKLEYIKKELSLGCLSK